MAFRSSFDSRKQLGRWWCIVNSGGEILHYLIGQVYVYCAAIKSNFQIDFYPIYKSVGIPSGLEAAVDSFSRYIDTYEDDPTLCSCCLKLDMSNAFDNCLCSFSEMPASTFT